ncbi:MAG: pilus assembly protein TadG-related protein [Candidatus Gastranaerophilales bacterium]|nr:pilus assembly protein TadG-related protein [Candidatus Gastranaerophilales bacterium]
MKQKRASTTIYIIFFFVIFLAFAAFAVDGAIVFANRIKLQNITETTALVAASEFNYSSTATASDIENHVKSTAEDTFDLLKKDGLSIAKINTQADATSNKILATTTMVSQPFFLRFLGVSGINLEAKACAVCEELNVTANYSGVNWVTTKAVYLSDILSKDLNMNDTAILLPLGKFYSASYNSTSGFADFSLISSDDSHPLTLGPGGFITIKLPAPIVDKAGYDLFIKEAGDAKEGYMVFAGLDNDADNPYTQHDNQGGGISWVNITCSGSPEDTSLTNPFGTASTELPTPAQRKIYGSAYFDLGDSCIGNISMAKYIRIIDDNDESAFVTDGTNYYKTKPYAEASTATAGIDIDYIKVLNHVKLVPPGSY